MKDDFRKNPTIKGVSLTQDESQHGYVGKK